MNMMDNTGSNETAQPLDEILNGALAQKLGLGTQELGVALATANAKLQSGQGEKALALYAMLVLCRPREVDYQCGLANCALQVQEYEVARQAAAAFIGLSPRDWRGYFFSGAACLGLGHLTEAREDIADALKFAEDAVYPEFYEASKKLSAHLDTSLA